MTTEAAPTDTASSRPENRSLAQQGLRPSGCVHWNLVAPELIQQAVRRDEGMLADMGPFVAITSPHTGRSPNDKFVVKEPASDGRHLVGKVNRPFEPKLRRAAGLTRPPRGSAELFVRRLRRSAPTPASAVGAHRQPEGLAQPLRAQHVHPRGKPGGAGELRPQLHGDHVAGDPGDPKRHGTRTSTFIVLSFAKRMILIGGTRYAGELKKSIFTVMNYLMPKQNVLSMHCSANVGEQGDTALFFGLSGTGKTTLSADPHRFLVGDDEHGWSDDGVFNFEGGCYAKVINLSAEGEPEIFATTQMFGTVLENVVCDPQTRWLDLDDDRLTENTRSSVSDHSSSVTSRAAARAIRRTSSS